MCVVCRTVPATVLNHCHEHGYVRAPVCQSCNTLEWPDHLCSNDVRVAGHYTRLFDTHAVDWLDHWHRCLAAAPAPPSHCLTSQHGPHT
ncbi:endonuclease domain-containing protein [Streptomyces phaeochromogenes]|uniref:endonuclease domain-containing protein n=1 Tax=Streptomyces phaeochromogenes TaxID=1923 RepID=UPI0033FA1980